MRSPSELQPADHSLRPVTDLSSPDAAPSESSGAITAVGLAARLGERTIWRDATFRIAAGEFVAVLGPNGAGKSTLLRLLLGLLQPSQGQLNVLGATPRPGSSEIGYVPQRRSLDPDLAARGRDFVALGVDGHRWGFALPAGSASRRKRERVAAALESVEATAYADRPIGQLSGGEQQRLLLAQALVGQPRLLLLDEPLASLDLRNQSAIAQLVARLARASGITVLLVAHDINPLLSVVNRVLYLARGQVVMGNPQDVITTESLSRLYGAPVEVVRDSRGRIVVVGVDENPHLHQELHEQRGPH
jgi:zinc/manganese transport system ATP-binding protein